MPNHTSSHQYGAPDSKSIFAKDRAPSGGRSTNTIGVQILATEQMGQRNDFHRNDFDRVECQKPEYREDQADGLTFGIQKVSEI